MTKIIEIRDVWTFNFEEEVTKIREIIQRYPYVAMVRMFICHVRLICSYILEYHAWNNYINYIDFVIVNFSWISESFHIAWSYSIIIYRGRLYSCKVALSCINTRIWDNIWVIYFHLGHRISRDRCSSCRWLWRQWNDISGSNWAECISRRGHINSRIYKNINTFV